MIEALINTVVMLAFVLLVPFLWAAFSAYFSWCERVIKRWGGL